MRLSTHVSPGSYVVVPTRIMWQGKSTLGCDIEWLTVSGAPQIHTCDLEDHGGVATSISGLPEGSEWLFIRNTIYTDFQMLSIPELTLRDRLTCKLPKFLEELPVSVYSERSFNSILNLSYFSGEILSVGEASLESIKVGRFVYV